MARHRPITMNVWGSSTGITRPCGRSSQEGRKRGHWASLNHLCLSHRSLQGRRNKFVPSGSGTLRTSFWVVLKDLETLPGDYQPNLLSQGGQEALSKTKVPPSEEVGSLSSKQGDLEELWQQKRVQKVQEKLNKKNPQALFWPKHTILRKQSRSNRKPWNGWLREGKQSERDCGAQTRPLKTRHSPPTEKGAFPVLQLPQDLITTNWVQWHSEKSAGARRSLSSSFTNYPSRGSSGRLARPEGRHQVPGVCHWSLTGFCQDLPYRAIQGH